MVIARIGRDFTRPSSGVTPPVEILDEVQLWARENDRRFGRVELNPILGCWCLHFGRKSTDPVLRAYQAGELEEEPTESVVLQEWDSRQQKMVPILLGELGAQGIRNLLDRANMLTGRGEVQSIQEGIQRTREHNAKIKQNQRKMVEENGREMDWLFGKQLRGEPVITPGIDLKKEN